MGPRAPARSAALAGRAPTAHRPLHGYLEWLNLVELWFGELTNKFRRGTQQSVRALNHDIRAWIKTWNDGPYGWAKTSEQILDSWRVTPRGLGLTLQDTRWLSQPLWWTTR